MDQNETTSMTNPYRAALVRLMNTIHDLRLEGGNAELKVALNTARALLAQPVAEGPSASDVTELFYRHMGEGSEVGFENAIAEALARWGRPAAAPVPVSERLPGLDVKCWWFDSTKQWYFRSWEEINIAGLRQPTHWLPFDALPLPTGEGG